MKVEYVFTLRFVVEENPGDEQPPIDAMREEFNREFAAEGELHESSFDVMRRELS